MNCTDHTRRALIDGTIDAIINQDAGHEVRSAVARADGRAPTGRPSIAGAGTHPHRHLRSRQPSVSGRTGRDATMYLGLDIGTSSVKAVLIDDGQRIIAQPQRAPRRSRGRIPAGPSRIPKTGGRRCQRGARRLWREASRRRSPRSRASAFPASMHGATLLDKAGKVLRPCILWNDARSSAECAELEAREPEAPRDHRQHRACRASPRRSWSG